MGGINEATTFGGNTNAGYKTAVTTGYFTINGVKITVPSGSNTADVVSSINSAQAGVVATYSQNTGQITLTATASGPQGIVLGAAGDTSNFLTAAGLKAAAGGTTTVGSQSEVDILTSNGTQKYFSNSNAVTTAIPGITLNLQSNTTTPFTVSVSQDTSTLVGAIQSFTSAYNAAVSEINAATAAPIVTAAAPGSGGQAKSIGGGVLFGNTNAQSIVQQLTQITAGFLGSGGSYNSLSQIGLSLSDSFQTLTTGNNSNSQGITGGSAASGTQSGATIQQTTYQGTDGTLQPLDSAKFLAAYEANPTAVTNLLNGSNGLTTQLGIYLTGVTGSPTLLNSGTVGNIPTISIIQNYENTNTDAISAYQQQIAQITDSANTQADTLRQQFVASESLIAQLQSQQQELAAALGFTVSSSSSST